MLMFSWLCLGSCLSQLLGNEKTSTSDQGVNPRLLHSQAGSLPLSHQGSPRMFFYSASVLRVSALCQLLPGAAGTECERDAPSWEEFWPGPAEETGDAHTAAP